MIRGCAYEKLVFINKIFVVVRYSSHLFNVLKLSNIVCMHCSHKKKKYLDFLDQSEPVYRMSILSANLMTNANRHLHDPGFHQLAALSIAC